MKKWISIILCAVLATLSMSCLSVSAAALPSMDYQLLLTDQNGKEVKNPRTLQAGDTLQVQIQVTRTDVNTAYDVYGMEFDVLSLGLQYNGDGSTYNGTAVTSRTYAVSRQLRVGFAFLNAGSSGFYGTEIAQSETVSRWSYTVTDPAAVNLTMDVALAYVMGNNEEIFPVGKAQLYLELNGGTLVGQDVQGEYTAGESVLLPGAEKSGFEFSGWSDGVSEYEAGSTYIPTGVVTLSAGWRVGGGLNSEDHIRYVQGYEDGTVRPNGMITRAETATMLYRLLTTARRDAIFTSDNRFPDVQQKDWFNKAVSSMANGAYINGYPTGYFVPNGNITRAEFVTMVTRFLGTLQGTAQFNDVPSTHWAWKNIAAAADAGWIAGYTDGSFKPDQAITRAEAVTILNRVLGRGVNAESQLRTPSMFSDNADPSQWYYYEIIEATNDHEYTGTRPSENWTSNTVHVSYDINRYERP